MSQLSLFEGSHLPRTAAREALAHGDLGGALRRLEASAEGTEEAADAGRLARIEKALQAGGDEPVGLLHDAFVSGLAEGGPGGFLSDSEWFAVYARHVARALDADPGRLFRGWCAAHYSFASGERDAAHRAADRIVECVPVGPAWLEAARLAFELGDGLEGGRRVHAACLEGSVQIVTAAPQLEPCNVPMLDAAPELPTLPVTIEELFDTVRSLEGIPEPGTRWVAVVGEIDRLLGPLDATREASTETPATDDDKPRAFLIALRAARRSRERDRNRGSEHCSDRELRARRHMQRLAPVLLERYLHELRGSLL